MSPRELHFTDPRLRQRYVEFRDLLNTYKLDRGCADCGYVKCAAALVLDHLDPDLKTAQVSTMFTYSHDNLLAELAKCEVRCANCHQERTYELGQMGPRYEDVLLPIPEWSLFAASCGV